MSEFSKKWVSSNTPGFGEKVRGSLSPAGPLKPRIDAAVRNIQIQVSKLENTSNRLKDRDGALFNKVVSSLQKHDMQHASVYSNELAEIRKMSKMVTSAKIALEQIVLRLSTATELGDIVVTLAPAMAVIKSVRSGLVGVMPEAEQEISEINGVLSSILVDAGQLGGLTLNFEAANEDAEHIMAEASAVAEQKMKDKFPEIPATGTEAGQSYPQ
ncbi:MAG: Snf7 family protein [Conexivisphaerales archaeon]|jgi:division protein CdvB (Snf7/Vps24/ESCRT-III family)